VCFTDHSTFQFSLRCMCPPVFQRLFIQDLMVLTSLSVYLCLYFTVLTRIVKYFFFLLHGRNRLPLISVISTNFYVIKNEHFRNKYEALANRCAFAYGMMTDFKLIFRYGWRRSHLQTPAEILKECLSERRDIDCVPAWWGEFSGERRSERPPAMCHIND